MPTINTFDKDPSAVLDYTFDWSAWLTSPETIQTAVITVPTGLTLNSTVVNPTQVTGWIAGGASGQQYTVTCHITTNSVPARQDQRTITIVVLNR